MSLSNTANVTPEALNENHPGLDHLKAFLRSELREKKEKKKTFFFKKVGAFYSGGGIGVYNKQRKK